jgi:hypothetical protein
MAKSNYQYQKYQKDLAKKKKREEKMRSKLARKNMKSRENTDQSSDDREII